MLAALTFMLTAQPSLASPKILVDVQTGTVLYEEDASKSWHPASVTKLMTANLAFKAIREGRATLRTPIVMTQHAASLPPSKLGLEVGHGLLLYDALRIMLTRSMNDVASAIAENLAGSEASFVAEMNTEAARLGMRGTRFTNPSGLPDASQVSTAEDLAILARHILLSYPESLPLFSIPELKVAGKTLKNTNGLIGKFEGADGMKTGYICSSGFNLVSTAQRNGRRLLSIVLGAPNTHKREKAASNLLEYGFKNASHSIRGLNSTVTAPSNASDMRKWQCGKTYPGFSTELKGATPELHLATPSPRPKEDKPPRIRRF
jgi:D-alanyl-D-alanine carboxypeptidase